MMFIQTVILSLCLHYTKSASLDELLAASSIPEDGRLGLCELANKYKMDCIRYNVTTEDGYILGLFNIPGDKTRPVFVTHGLAAAADVFLVRGNASWVGFLASKGYDVWLGNSRGNMHSRAHVSLDPNELEFWDFSLHEMSKYDIPAMTDFILEKTEQKQLYAVSHSEATIFFFALGALRPEYNDKFKLVICLAPIAYLHNAAKGFVPLLPKNLEILSPIASLIAHGEVFANNSVIVSLMKLLCADKVNGYEICAENIMFRVLGRDTDGLEPEILSTAMARYPSGTSLKNGVHLVQFGATRRFAEFDYGYWNNLLVYNSTLPPLYNLSKNTMKIAMVVGLNDKASNIKDVKIVRRQLPNVVEYHIMKPKAWNHADYVFGRHMGEHLFGYIDDLSKKYY